MKKSYCTLEPHLYVGDRVRNAAYLKWRLTRGFRVRTILLAEAPGMPGHLSVIHAYVLNQSYYREHPLRVYGIASSRAEAQELLRRISDEAAKAGMPGQLKRYLDRGPDT